eukprot:s6612_g5.t1
MNDHHEGCACCQWMRARQLLEGHRKDCVEQQLYFEAAVADARAKELMQLERAWQLEARLFTLVVAPVDVLSIRAA